VLFIREAAFNVKKNKVAKDYMNTGFTED
jgi:hypothetical protein